MAGRGGAVYKLIHDKTNAVNAIRELTETMVSKLESSGEDDEQLTAVLSIFEQRRSFMDEADRLDRQLKFLEDSGYAPDEAEQRRIALEEETIIALLKRIQTLDTRARELILAAQENLMNELKDVRDGQRSIMAYNPVQEEEEGQQVDTRR